MNEQSPYEPALIKQLATLAVPDENRAWADMLARLDKEDDDGIVVPPIRKGCATYFVVAFLLLLGAGTFVIWHNNRHKEQADKINTIDSNNPNSQALLLKKEDSGNSANNNTNPVTTNTVTGLPKNKTAPFSNGILANDIVKNKKAVTINGQTAELKNRQKSFKKTDKKSSGNTALENVTVNGKRHKKTSAKTSTDKKEIWEDDAEQKNVAPLITGSKNNSSNDAIDSTGDTSTAKSQNKTDTATKKAAAKKAPTADTNKDKKENTSKNNLSFAAGLSLFQQIPFDGQTAAPYNAQGRKLSLLDYIPAVYFRVYKKQKAFLQIAFRYGAPQLTKEFTYSTKIVKDSSGSFDTATTYRLKKSYYHQLPVSLHYNLSPHFSAGVGLMWSKFSSAVAEQQVNATNQTTGITKFVSSKILEVKKDSSFTSSNLQALVDMEYRWKRFSLGAMYAFGLQPYIKYQSADGKPQQQKNTSLQVFLRYELWRSKQKK